MPITVEAHAQYLTAHVPQMRGVDFDALVFVHALKGRAFGKGYARVRASDGSVKVIDQQHPEVASEIFVDWAVKRILARQWGGPICLVPVPNKSALVSAAGQSFPTLVLAERLAKRFKPDGVHVQPKLRWRRDLQKAQEGGSRQAWDLYPELVLMPVPPGMPTRIVLVDDVCTTGGHLQACAAKLTAAGCVADYAVCGAKTFHEQQAEPFSLHTITLPDHVPGSNPFGFEDETAS